MTFGAIPRKVGGGQGGYVPHHGESKCTPLFIFLGSQMIDRDSYSDSPDYACLAYREASPRWEYLWDMYCGSDNWLFRLPGGGIVFGEKVRAYLPPEPNEPEDAYRSRVLMSLFERRFARSIRIYTDLVLHDYSLVVPEGSSFDVSNLDRRGTPFYNFWAQVAINALVLGHSFVLVDREPGEYGSEFERRQRGKPFLVNYSPLDLINWRVDQGGIHLLVFKETVVRPFGSFGEQVVLRYRVLRPGSWELWEKDGADFVLVGRGRMSERIPLVVVYSHQIGVFASDPPLRTLADLNLAHYQLSSDHRQKLHKCCLPTPVRIGSLQGSDLVLGPNTFVDLPEGGDFKWAEPQALSLGESRREIEALEATIDLYGLDYLSRGSVVGTSRATRLEIALSAAPVEVTLSGFCRRFEAAIQEVLDLWAEIAGEPVCSVELPGRLKLESVDPQMILTYIRLSELNLITRRTLLHLLRDQGCLPRDFDIEAELATVGE